MYGIDGIHVLRATRVAGQASVGNCLHRGILECENLRDIAATIDVRLTQPMAPLTALL